MSNESIVVSDTLQRALRGLTARLMANSGITPEEVGAVIQTYFATDAEAVDPTNTERLLTPRGGYLSAKAVLDEWVGAAPEALDTLVELAAAFNNNPDVINELTAQLALKETPEGAQAKVDTLEAELLPLIQAAGDGAGLILDFDLPDNSKWVSLDTAVLNAIPTGKYFGYCKASTVGLGDAINVPDGNSIVVDEVIALEVTVFPHPVHTDTVMVERTARCGRHLYMSRLDTSFVNATTVKTSWEKAIGYLDHVAIQCGVYHSHFATANSFAVMGLDAVSAVLNFNTGALAIANIYTPIPAGGPEILLSIDATGWTLKYTTGRLNASNEAVYVNISAGAVLPEGAAAGDYQIRMIAVDGTPNISSADNFVAFGSGHTVTLKSTDVSALDFGLTHLSAVVSVEVKHVVSGSVVKSMLPMNLLIDLRGVDHNAPPPPVQAQRYRIDFTKGLAYEESTDGITWSASSLTEPTFHRTGLTRLVSIDSATGKITPLSDTSIAPVTPMGLWVGSGVGSNRYVSNPSGADLYELDVEVVEWDADVGLYKFSLPDGNNATSINFRMACGSRPQYTLGKHYTLSFIVKSSKNDGIGVNYYSGAFSDEGLAQDDFGVNFETLQCLGFDSSVNVVDSSVVSLGNDMYRVSATFGAIETRSHGAPYEAGAFRRVLLGETPEPFWIGYWGMEESDAPTGQLLYNSDKTKTVPGAQTSVTLNSGAITGSNFAVIVTVDNLAALETPALRNIIGSLDETIHIDANNWVQYERADGSLTPVVEITDYARIKGKEVTFALHCTADGVTVITNVTGEVVKVPVTTFTRDKWKGTLYLSNTPVGFLEAHYKELTIIDALVDESLVLEKVVSLS